MMHMIARRIFTALLTPFLFLASCTAEGDKTAVSVQTLREKLAKDPTTVVVDVRNADELSGPLGKLDGVKHIPLADLPSRLSELSAHKNREIHIICRSGNRSGKAASFLREKGFQALNVTGGMISWRSSFQNANR